MEKEIKAFEAKSNKKQIEWYWFVIVIVILLLITGGGGKYIYDYDKENKRLDSIVKAKELQNEELSIINEELLTRDTIDYVEQKTYYYDYLRERNLRLQNEEELNFYRNNSREHNYRYLAEYKYRGNTKAD